MLVWRIGALEGHLAALYVIVVNIKQLWKCLRTKRVGERWSRLEALNISLFRRATIAPGTPQALVRALVTMLAWPLIVVLRGQRNHSSPSIPVSIYTYFHSKRNTGALEVFMSTTYAPCHCGEEL